MINSTSAPTLEDEEKLRLALAEVLTNFTGNTILGAQLGTHLNTLLKPGTYKSWLNEGSQNLRTFVETFLKGIITPTTTRQGNDFLFQIEGKSLEVEQSFGGALWKAFCTLRPGHAIRVKRKANTLYLTPVGSDEAPEDPTIAPVSIDEHRTMCQDFVRHLDSEGRANRQLREISNSFEHRSYATWVTALKSETGLFGEWGAFRVAHIKELFAQRIQALTAEEAVRDRLVRDFEADYLSQRAAKSGAPNAQATPTAAPTLVARTIEHGTRQALAKALETLDDAQIAKILVPLDVVMALLAERKP